MSPPFSRSFLLCMAYGVLHLWAHLTAAWFEVPAEVAVSIWYPPAGLALSLLILLGPRYAGVVFAANVAGALITGAAPDRWSVWVFPALITAVYAATAWAVRRFAGGRLLPGDWRSTLVFIAVIVGAPLVVALLGSALALAGRPWDAAVYARSAFDWWVGDASGLLTVVPAAMVFVRPWLKTGSIRRQTEWGRALLAGVQVAVLLGSVLVVMAVPVLREHYAFFFSFLPLVWICAHHGLPGATLATLGVTLTGVAGMAMTGGAADFAYVFLMFEVAVAGVGLGLGSMVSRREEAEQRLASSQAMLDRVIVGAQAGVWDWDRVHRRIGTNAELARILGYEPEEIMPFERHWSRLVHRQDWREGRHLVIDHLAGRTPLCDAEFRLRAKAGHWHWVRVRGSVVERDDSGMPRRVAGIFVDLQERKRAEAKIERLTSVVGATPDFVLSTDGAGRVWYANAAFMAVWGADRAGATWIGRNVSDLLGGPAGRRIRDEIMPAAAAAPAGTWRGELCLMDPRAREIPVSLVALAHREADSDVLSFSFVMHDLTAHYLAEADRRQRERDQWRVHQNESLGVLAGGIAHDFNNLMTAVLGNANVARLDLAPDSDAAECLEQIEQAAVRAAGLCQQLLAYAGRNPVAFAELDLNPLVADTLRLVESTVSKRITLIFEPGAGLRPLLAAPTQTQQVVMNLILNAAQAIGKREGRVRVRTGIQTLDADEMAAAFPELPPPAPGDFAVLEVDDDGGGMAPEVKARIFEPYFSTKESGQGLGLAAVIGFVRSHRGAIRVRSAPGEGTTFCVALPFVPAPAEAPVSAPAHSPLRAMVATAGIDGRSHANPSAAPGPERPWSDGGKVLLVDDDPTLRSVIERLLVRLGFEVVLAEDGVAGVEAFAVHADHLRFVLLDLTMPRMDGFEAHRRMHARAPAVPVIFMSGYSQKLAQLPPEAIHPAAVLAKPFGLAELQERLAAVLPVAVAD